MNFKALRFLSLLAVVGIFVFSHCLSVRAEGKIAIVNLQKALNESDEGKKAMASIKAEVDSKQKELEDMKTKLKQEKDDLDKQQAVLSQDALKTKSADLQNKLMDLQQKAAQYEQDIKTKENDSVQKILTALKSTVVDMAKKNGYDMVYENSADTILYYADSKAVDITDDLIKAYNKK